MWDPFVQLAIRAQRKMVCETRGLDPWQRADLRNDLLKDRAALRCGSFKGWSTVLIIELDRRSIVRVRPRSLS